MTAAEHSIAPGHAVPAAAPRLDICIVAHLAYGALAGRPGHIGGVEYQTSLLARWLAARGHRVQMITWDEGQGENVDVHGVRVLPLCRRDAGWPIVRFVHPRWSSLVAALARANAALYYQNCGESVTGQVALWCRARGRRFVFSSASDADCDRRLPFLRTYRERVLYRAGLARADRIVVQSAAQRERMRQDFGHDATVLPMPVEDRSAGRSARRAGGRVVWIGRLAEVKRPDRLVALAEASPHLHFDLVGPDDGSDYARDVVERARARGNITVHGPLSREGVAAVLADAAVLCNTSDIEGFPNTFLEAWSHAVPVVSLFDPDGLIARERLGWIAPNGDGLATLLNGVLGDAQNVARVDSPALSWEAASASARRYYVEHHTVEAVMPRFEALFADVLGVRS